MNIIEFNHTKENQDILRDRLVNYLLSNASSMRELARKLNTSSSVISDFIARKRYLATITFCKVLGFLERVDERERELKKIDKSQ